MSLNDEILQERLDELLMVEQKAQDRAKKLTEYGQYFQEQAKRTLERLDGVVCMTSNELGRLKDMNRELEKQRQAISTLKKKTIVLCMMAIILIGLICCGAYAWLGYLQKQIELASLKLEMLDLKLSSTPVVVKFNGDNYVRIIQDTVTTLGRGEKPIGVYAKAWHEQR